MLATIEKILAIGPVEGADRIEVATVQGWVSVIKKDEYKVGDLIVFIKPDTLVPRAEWNKFLWPKRDLEGDSKIRLRVCKFKGQISMGLIISTSYLSEGTLIEEGADVTEALGVIKYEANHDFKGMGCKGGFPSWLRISDEENVLSSKRAFEETKDKEIYIKIKYDGSSGKAVWRENEFKLYSRRLEVFDDEENPWAIVSKQYNLKEKLAAFNEDIAICFEVCGPKMNGNKMGLASLDLFVYDFWDIAAQRYFSYDKFEEYRAKLELPTTDVFFVGTNPYNEISDLQKDIDVLKYKNGEWIEGVVVRPTEETFSPALRSRLSWKLINSSFAAKYL